MDQLMKSIKSPSQLVRKCRNVDEYSGIFFFFNFLKTGLYRTINLNNNIGIVRHSLFKINEVIK